MPSNPDKKREYNRKYREDNRERLREYNRKYRQEHREERNESKKRDRQRLKEYWKDKDPYEENDEKLCPSCGHLRGPLPAHCFAKNTCRPSGLSDYCRDCNAYQSSVDNSKKKNQQHTISLENWLKLRHDDCVYCGRMSTIEEPNGVDRILSSKGYTEDNVQTACTMCNCMKLDHEHEDFIKQMKVILEHQGYILEKRK